MKGLLVFVYRGVSFGDCTAGGMSSRVDKFVLINDEQKDAEVFEPDGDAPALVLVRRWAGTSREYLHAEPLDKPDDKLGPMMGGNFIYSSDSRFPSSYPIPIHDRFETQEQYDANWD